MLPLIGFNDYNYFNYDILKKKKNKPINKSRLIKGVPATIGFILHIFSLGVKKTIKIWNFANLFMKNIYYLIIDQ